MFLKLLTLSLVLIVCDGYKILGLFPHPGKSHFDVFKPLLKELALKGHDVTVISHFPLDKPLGNYTDITLRKEKSGVLVDVFSIENIPTGKLRSYYEPIAIHNLGKISCEQGLQNKQVQQLLRSSKKFDLAMVEMFNTHCFAGIIRKLGIPFIGVTSHALMPWSNSWFGTPGSPSYIPVLFLDHSDRMDFLERVENAVIYVLHNLYYNYVVTMDSDGYSRKYAGVSIPSDFMRNASLVLTNVHYTLNRPKAVAPNVIEVGGIHINKQSKLPGVSSYI